MHQYASFVALGDSFTEGLDDPGADGLFRGWADLVACRLAAARPGFRYANLAIRGRMFDTVAREQVPVALAMTPDLVSLAAGANDAMRGRFDHSGLGSRLDEVAGQIVARGATLVLFTTASDLARRLPAGRILARRLAVLNELVRNVAATHGAVLIEHEGERALTDPRMWSTDRIHLSTFGHQRVAARVMAALGVAGDPAWTAPLPPYAAPPWTSARRADLVWARDHMTPWARRRLTGQSSGDTLAPKRPRLELLT